MKRKSSAEYSVVFLGKQKLIQVLHLCSRFARTANWVGTIVEFAVFRSGLDLKYSGASAFWFFRSTTMVFAAVRTHFPKKNTLVYRKTVTCITRVTSNRVDVHRLNSQHLAVVWTSNMFFLVITLKNE